MNHSFFNEIRFTYDVSRSFKKGMWMKCLFIIVLTLWFDDALWADHKVLRRHDCTSTPFVQKSNTLIFVGRFESFEESPSPRILDSSREEMIRFECEDVPVNFYVPKDAKHFLNTLSEEDKLKIYGYLLAF